jgi:hypothetical protein
MFAPSFQPGSFVRKLSILGIVFAILGVGGLLLGHFSYSETKPVVDAGPIHVATQEEHQVSIPTIACIVVLVAGIALIVIDRRSA